MAVRQEIEGAFEPSLRAVVELPALNATDSDGVAKRLFAMARARSKPAWETGISSLLAPPSTASGRAWEGRRSHHGGRGGND